MKPQRPQRGDVVITTAVDGFWTHRPLDDRRTPGTADTLEADCSSWTTAFSPVYWSTADE